MDGIKIDNQSRKGKYIQLFNFKCGYFNNTGTNKHPEMEGSELV